jgi:hypothetical protein
VTDRTTIKALIEEAYEARRVEDIERIIAVFHPNAKLQIAGSKEITTAAGTAEGHEEIRRISTALIASFQFVERDILSFLRRQSRLCSFAGSPAFHSEKSNCDYRNCRLMENRRGQIDRVGRVRRHCACQRSDAVNSPT